MKKSIGVFLTNHWDALLASAAACMAIYFLTRFAGIGLSPDSVSYSVAAINLKEKGALIDFNSLPMVDFPAGYALFLSATYFLTGVQPVPLAPILNAGLYTGLILLSSVYLQSFKGISRAYRILFFIMLASSPCLWEVYGMIWSETLFLLLVILFFLAWKNYVAQKSDGSVLLFALVAALAFLTRFAGISLLATGAALLFFDGTVPIFKKIKQLLLFSVTGISLVVLNLIRNHHASGTLSGVREKALRTVADNLLDIGAVLGGWFPFIGEHVLAGAILFCTLVAFAAFQILYRIIQQQFYLRNETAVYGFFLVYSIFIVTVSSISRFETLSSRLLSPMYIPMLWVATSWIPGFIAQKTKAIRYTLVLVSTLFALAFFKNQYQQNAANWEGIAYAGIPGYSETQWKKSPMVKYINTHRALLTGAIYSDAYDGLYYLTGVKSLPLPHKEIETEKQQFFANPSLIVVWFNDGVNNDLIGLEEIAAKKKLLNSIPFEDGAIYFYGDAQLHPENPRN